jgi:hypothetical protein
MREIGRDEQVLARLRILRPSQARGGQVEGSRRPHEIAGPPAIDA